MITWKSAKLVLALAALVVVFPNTGCKKSGVDTEAVEAAQESPMAAKINAALEKKEYDAVVGILIKMRQEATDEKKLSEALTLSSEVKMKLMDLAPTDPKANEALNAIRSITAGR